MPNFHLEKYSWSCLSQSHFTFLRLHILKIARNTTGDTKTWSQKLMCLNDCSPSTQHNLCKNWWLVQPSVPVLFSIITFIAVNGALRSDHVQFNIVNKYLEAPRTWLSYKCCLNLCLWAVAPLPLSRSHSTVFEREQVESRTVVGSCQDHWRGVKWSLLTQTFSAASCTCHTSSIRLPRNLLRSV